MDEIEGPGTITAGCPSTVGNEYQLNLTTLIRHAARTYPEQEIVYRRPDGGWARYTYADCYARVIRSANALRDLGLRPGERAGVLDWNSRRHFELYYSICGVGGVMLQLNQRLALEDLAYVVNHGEARFILVDESLLGLAESLAPLTPGVQAWLVMTDRPLEEISTPLSPIRHYEDMLAGASAEIRWPMIDERSACAACYTTGTTGRPKGVYYAHRSEYLHTLVMTSILTMSADDCTMLITPMFHGQCWGLPHAAIFAATKIVLPGRYMAEDTGPLVDAIIAEEVTVVNGAPAIFMPMLHYIETLPEKPDFRRLRMLSGATEPPLSMMRGFYELTGAEVIQAYGATETSPLVSLNRVKPSLRKRLSQDELWNLRRKQGLMVSGVDFRILGPDDRDLPFDGVCVGEICVRGPWISTSYHNMPGAAQNFIDGYWRSGDVGSIDPDGYIKVTDRVKDVVKSGGEWISSIDMENALTGHPAVLEAAVVGIAHPKWQERPLALVVLRPGKSATMEELHAHLLPHFAKWQLPDEILFVAELPRTSVGKMNKKLIREQFSARYQGAAAS
ncbi:long-chain-fatty-acid--CoA ligase [Acidocella sp.]|uniref:long-chain-fatty-acid--CoA ligase n=1 Tax=Acidocella sp. TaxID=50710 RepID=UPI0026252F49|nr:long-chain-fatty-acid--CoA ligase [Acidocella sp.]